MKRSAWIGLAVLLAVSGARAMDDVMLSQGRAPDSSAKIMSELRDSERRKIPLEVAITARAHYPLNDAVPITITVTNLFDPPLLLNNRMLVNHRLLPGEISFIVVDPHGKRCDFQRLVSPGAVTNDDFLLLARGMSMQRTVDLADYFSLSTKGVYKVQAFYRNESGQLINGTRAWLGIAPSEVTEIEIQ